MARLMKTRQEQPLRYVELARQGVRLARSMSVENLPRWSELVDGQGEVDLELTFYQDDDGLPCVRGSYRARAGMLCRRCLEVVDHVINGYLQVCIVRDDGQASALAAGRDVVMVAGDQLLLAEIIEDELLLEMPERLCVFDDCDRSLPMSHPVTDAEPVARTNPFGVLTRLKEDQDGR